MRTGRGGVRFFLDRIFKARRCKRMSFSLESVLCHKTVPFIRRETRDTRVIYSSQGVLLDKGMWLVPRNETLKRRPWLPVHLDYRSSERFKTLSFEKKNFEHHLLREKLQNNFSTSNETGYRLEVKHDSMDVDTTSAEEKHPTKPKTQLMKEKRLIWTFFPYLWQQELWPNVPTFERGTVRRFWEEYSLSLMLNEKKAQHEAHERQIRTIFMVNVQNGLIDKDVIHFQKLQNKDCTFTLRKTWISQRQVSFFEKSRSERKLLRKMF